MNICNKCGHTWKSRAGAPPKICPKCKTKKWRRKNTIGDLEAIESILNNIYDGYHSGNFDIVKGFEGYIIYNALSQVEEIVNDMHPSEYWDSYVNIIEKCKDISIIAGLPKGSFIFLSKVEFSVMNDMKNSEIKDSKIKEIDIENTIVENWDSIDVFKTYNFVSRQVKTKDNEMIDILAESKITSRPVIIELKKGNKDGYRQLRSYGTSYHSPILVNVSEKSVSNKKEGILYFTLDDMPNIKEALTPLFKGE